MARALLAAGAPVEGDPADPETPLMTAASYGDAEVARMLVEAGADLAAAAGASAGGVPGGTALRHAAVFGMAEVAEVLVAAGATDLVHSAAAGVLGETLTPDTPREDRVAALRIAAEHGRLEVIVRAVTPASAPPRCAGVATGASGTAEGKATRRSSDCSGRSPRIGPDGRTALCA